MATYTLPPEFVVKSFGIQLDDNSFSAESPFTRDDQVIDLLGERWVFSFTTLMENALTKDAGAIESFFFRLRGKQNKVRLHNFARPIPIGTLRGLPNTTGVALQGDSVISISAPTGATLEAGDMFGVAGLLLMAAEPCVSVAGIMVVPTVQRLRRNIPDASAVVWDKPTAEFKLLSSPPKVSYSTVIQEEFAMDFVETW